MSENLSSTKKNYANTFDIPSILKDILKRLHIIFICGCICAMGAYVYSTESYTPKYKTETTFLIADKNEERNPYSSLSTTTSLASVFITLIDSSEFQSKVAQNLDSPQVPGTISATQVPETNMITLQCTSTTPILSYSLLQTILSTYPEFTREIMTNMITETLEPPIVPTTPINGSTVFMTTIKAFLLGCIAVCALIAIFSYFRDTIKTTSDIKKKLDIPLIDVVPKEYSLSSILKSLTKRNVYLDVKSKHSFHFIEAFRKIRATLEVYSNSQKAQTFVVTSSLPNEGKTTVASNIAVSLAKKNLKVMLIDADLRNPSVANFFNINVSSKKQWSKFLSGDKKLNDVIVHDKSTNIDFLINKNRTNAVSDLFTTNPFEYIFETLKMQYDYIIVDTPPLGLTADTEDILRSADATLLVIKQNSSTTASIVESIDTINNVGTTLLGCILNNSSLRKPRYWYGSDNYSSNKYTYGN